MKLLFDENLSPRLVSLLAAIYPGSVHVTTVGLRGVSDVAVWGHAATNGFAIVTKDTDFLSRAVLSGPPHKIIWLRVGNVSTARIETLLRERRSTMEEFASDPDAAILVVE